MSKITLVTVALLSGITVVVALEAPTTAPTMPSPGGAAGTMPMTVWAG